MKTLYEDTELNVPSYALSYLVNGDSSGIEQEDIDNIDNWYNWYVDKAKSLSKTACVIFLAGEGEADFSISPEFGLPCDVVECSILIVDSEPFNLHNFFGDSHHSPDYFKKIRGVSSSDNIVFTVTENDMFYIKHKEYVSRTKCSGVRVSEEITICKTCIHKNELTGTIYRKEPALVTRYSKT